MRSLVAVIARDLRATLRSGGSGVPLGFFLAVGVLLPFGLGPEPSLLVETSAGAVWISALLACLLSLDRLFRGDLENGSLALLAMAPLPFELVVVAKCLASWLTTGLPVAAAAPLLGLLHGTTPVDWLHLALSLLIGTPALTLLGALGASLAAGLRSPGLLAPLIVVPLTVPVLIFGAAAASGVDALLALGAIALGSLAVAPWAIAASLKSGME